VDFKWSNNAGIAVIRRDPVEYYLFEIKLKLFDGDVRQSLYEYFFSYIVVTCNAVGAGDAAAPLQKLIGFGLRYYVPDWLDKIKILHPQKHSISYGYDNTTCHCFVSSCLSSVIRLWREGTWLFAERRASNRKVSKPWFDSRCGSAVLCPLERHLTLIPILGQSNLPGEAQPEAEHRCRGGKSDTKHKQLLQTKQQ